jgi:hypothetical protein
MAFMDTAPLAGASVGRILDFMTQAKVRKHVDRFGGRPMVEPA